MRRFTKRQVEIGALVSEGLSNAEIANRLGISENTVRYHLKELYLRLGDGKRVALIRLYLGGRGTTGRATDR